MQGRKPTPTVLFDLHGRPNKSRKPNPNEPMPEGNLHDPPEHLTDSQQAGWWYAIEHAPPGLLKMIDRSILVTWVVAEDTHRLATIGLAKTGLLIKSPTVGLPIQSPYLPIINRQAGVIKDAINELGFSPAARPRIGAANGHVAPLRTTKAKADLGAPSLPLNTFLAEHPAH
jgi:phage terminase small subunit